MGELGRYIWLLWDAGAVLLIASLVRQSAERGFVRTLLGLAGYVVALLVARYGSPYLAELLYENVVRDAIKLVLAGNLEEALAGGGASAGELVGLIPFALQRIMGGNAEDAAAQALDSGMEQVVETLINAALREPVLSILQGLTFLLLFSLVMLAVRFVSGLFYGVFKLPILGSVNAVLGGIVGVGKAVLVLILVALVAQLVILATGGGYPWLNPQVIDDTYVFRVFYRILQI